MGGAGTVGLLVEGLDGAEAGVVAVVEVSV